MDNTEYYEIAKGILRREIDRFVEGDITNPEKADEAYERITESLQGEFELRDEEICKLTWEFHEECKKKVPRIAAAIFDAHWMQKTITALVTAGSSIARIHGDLETSIIQYLDDTIHYCADKDRDNLQALQKLVVKIFRAKLVMQEACDEYNRLIRPNIIKIRDEARQRQKESEGEDRD